MAKENKSEGALPTSECKASGCKKKGARLGFCDEHFVWFKEGLLDKHGQRPTDFDKKHQAWLSRKSS